MGRDGERFRRKKRQIQRPLNRAWYVRPARLLLAPRSEHGWCELGNYQNFNKEIVSVEETMKSS